MEDKIVKNFFKLYSGLNKNPSRYVPLQKSNSNLFKFFTKKAQVPKNKEVEENIRSRSAKLRFAIRNNNPFFFPEDFKKKFENYFKFEEVILWQLTLING